MRDPTSRWTRGKQATKGTQPAAKAQNHAQDARSAGQRWNAAATPLPLRLVGLSKYRVDSGSAVRACHRERPSYGDRERLRRGAETSATGATGHRGIAQANTQTSPHEATRPHRAGNSRRTNQDSTAGFLEDRPKIAHVHARPKSRGGRVSQIR